MRLFWELASLSFRRHLTYRAAAVAGLLTNFFFGILRVSVLVALYGQRSEVAGMTVQDAITYTGLTQAVIAYLSIFGWYDLMRTVHSGDVAGDLLKPMNYMAFWLAQDVGRAVVAMLLRGVTIMALYAVVFDLTVPSSAWRWLALAVSVVMSLLVSFAWRFLVNLSAFWSPNALGAGRFAFILPWFASGFLMPLRYFPDWVVTICYLTPFPHMLNTVVEVYLGLASGPEVVRLLAMQALWLLALLAAGQWALRAGVRRLVILGGEAEVTGTLDIYRRLLGVQLRSQLQYPVSFTLDLFGTALITLLEFGSFALVMWRFESIGGWTLGEVAFLFGLVESAFGVMDMLLAGFDPQDFGQEVRRGTFDRVLLKPVSATLQVLGSRLALRRLGRVVLGLAIFGWGVDLAGVQWTAAKLAYLPVVYASVVAFFGGLFIIGSTITFWTVESIEVVNVFTYGGKELTSYPMHIYPVWMRRFFTYVVPAGFLNYYPALYFLGKVDPTGMPSLAAALSPVAGFGMLAVALAFWRFGIRHYQSTGS